MLTAKELRSQREQHKLTQADVAKTIGVDEKVIASYESGDVPITAEHEEKLKKLWAAPPVKAPAAAPVKAPVAPPVKAPIKPQAIKPARQAASPAAPAVTQWLQDIAHDKPERPVKPAPAASVPAASAPAAASVPTDGIIQAAAQVTVDKQRRMALENLLSAALTQINAVFTEDKQVAATAESIDKLQPAHRQIVMSLIEQFEQIKDPPIKGKVPAHEQIVQAVKGKTPYDTALNYLNAAIQLLKQAEIADRPPLMSRLQSLSEFDRGTISMMTRRYQDTRKGGPDDKTS